jgi:hypothetical protein
MAQQPGPVVGMAAPQRLCKHALCRHGACSGHFCPPDLTSDQCLPVADILRECRAGVLSDTTTGRQATANDLSRPSHTRKLYENGARRA